MLGSQIEELLASEMEANGDFAVITDKAIVLCSDYKSQILGPFWEKLVIISRSIFRTILGTSFNLGNISLKLKSF